MTVPSNDPMLLARTSTIYRPAGGIEGYREVHDEVSKVTVAGFSWATVKEAPTPAAPGAYILAAPGCSYFGESEHVKNRMAASDNNLATPNRPIRWPFEVENYPPSAWWRRLPPEAFGDAERLLLVKTLRRISVLRGGDDLEAAIRGDAAAAIGAALGLMPIEEITTRVDITITALMCIALHGNAAPALVMAQVVGLTDVGHELAGELAAAWLAFGERHSGEPAKFGEAQVVLLAAFEEHRNKGDDA